MVMLQNATAKIACETLLTPHGLDELALSKALATLSSRSLDYADLYFQSCKREAWMLEEGRVSSGDFSITQGVGVRAVAGERSALAYSHGISPAALLEAAQTVRAIGGGATSRRGGRLLQSTSAPVERYACHDPLASLDAAAKVELLQRLEKRARALDPRVKGVMVKLSGEHDVVLVARRDGLIATDVRPLARLKVVTIVQQGGRRARGAACIGGRATYAQFTDEQLNFLADEAVRLALLKLEGRPAPAGAMPVVMGPGLPGILLHESVGHGLEGDLNRKQASAFSGRIGQRVAAPGVTVIDDGTIAGHCGSLTIDDEGNATRRTTLIENGILIGYMHDALSARQLRMPLTGNARRESFAHQPMPRMTNTCMLAGDYDAEEILSSVRDGVYVANLGGGQVDPTNGKFVFDAVEAYRIENGRLAYPLVDATLIGNGPEILRHVSMIGNDMRLDPGNGNCGKKNQVIPVGVGQPTLRIDGLTVGGTA